MNVELYEVMLLFAFYSFAGWAVEIAYHAVTVGKYVNRGFLSGPVCPIYGVGVIAVLAVLMPLKGNFILLFVGAVIVTSLIELVTGALLYKCFGMRWWDYSNEPFNLGGYVCLKFSLIWGLACVIVVSQVEPIIEKLIHIMPIWLDFGILLVFYVIFVIDAIDTVGTVLKLKKELYVVKEITAKLKESSIEIGENIAEGVVNLEAKKEEIAAKRDELEAKARILAARTQEEMDMVSKELAERTHELTDRGQEYVDKINKDYHERTKVFTDFQSQRVEEIAAKIYKNMEDHSRMIKAFPNLTNEMLTLVLGDVAEEYKAEIKKSVREHRLRSRIHKEGKEGKVKN